MANPEGVNPRRLHLKWLPIWLVDLKWLPISLVLSLAESAVLPMYIAFANVALIPLLTQSSAYLPLFIYAGSWFFSVWSLVLTLVYKWGLYGTFREGKPDAVGSWAAYAAATCQAAFAGLESSCESLKGTAAWNAVLRAMGADIGTDACCFSSGSAVEFDMLKVGERTILGPDVSFGTHILDNGAYSYAPVVIGDDCTLDEGSSMGGHSTLQARVHLLPHSRGMKGMTLLEGRVYGGNPADVTHEAAQGAADPRPFAHAAATGQLAYGTHYQRLPHDSTIGDPPVQSPPEEGGAGGFASRVLSLGVRGWFGGQRRTDGETTSLLGQHGDVESATGMTSYEGRV
jgi:acetyltransferase-like isoleucine patch superfamily enzyme